MLELLLKRRSIRQFKDKKVEKEKIENILKCALVSPSSRSVMPWYFTVVDNKDTIKKLSKSKLHGSELIEGSPLAIVVSADPSKTDVWIEDCSIACTIIQLAAEDLGLSSCWVQIRGRMHNDNETSEDFVKKTLNIPKEMVIEAVIAIGYKNEIKKHYEESELDYSKVSYNNYDEKYFK